MPEAIQSGVSALLGLTSGESWQDRLREAAYRSPKGTRIKFLYEDVSRTYTRRGTAFEFSGVDDAYVQQKGFGARRYPMLVFFSGKDHDRVALAFEAALLEPGIGTLEHPLYGKVDVVPFGDITRRDDLKSAANQSIIEVTFWTTIKDLYPRAGTPRENEILAALGAFDVEAAQQFSDSTDLLTAARRANLKGTIRGLLRQVSSSLQAVSDATASVRREFDDTFRLVNFGMDVLIGQPLGLAQQISNLIKAPARAAAGIQSRLDGYARFAQSIFGSQAGRPSDHTTVIANESRLVRMRNDFHAADLMALNAVAGSLLSLVNHQFSTKPEALGAAAEAARQFDELVAWRDDGFTNIGQPDFGDSYQALQQAVAVAVAYLIEVSFVLVPERRIVLDRPRTIIDLAAELYGSVDDRLDFLIESNGLTGSQILELPRGHAVVYYPTPR